jgi:hypothetical protein
MWTGSSRGRRFEGFFACARLPSSPWLAFSWLPFPCFLFPGGHSLLPISCFPFPGCLAPGRMYQSWWLRRTGPVPGTDQGVGGAGCVSSLRFSLVTVPWLPLSASYSLLPIPGVPGTGESVSVVVVASDRPGARHRSGCRWGGVCFFFALSPASPSCLSALPSSVPLPISAAACSLARCIRGLGGESGL